MSKALAFYRKIFSFELRGRGQGSSFYRYGRSVHRSDGNGIVALGIDTGTFELVVDDRFHVRELARESTSQQKRWPHGPGLAFA
jgi:hypothetical protein